MDLRNLELCDGRSQKKRLMHCILASVMQAAADVLFCFLGSYLALDEESDDDKFFEYRCAPSYLADCCNTERRNMALTFCELGPLRSPSSAERGNDISFEKVLKIVFFGDRDRLH